jgi:dihydroorotate dehydrogenase (NAD+) catalytic subunit
MHDQGELHDRAPDELIRPAIDTAVTLGELRLDNPIMPASGCFGPELAPVCDVARLGATVTKTIFRDRRPGNAAHRVTDAPLGMLNSVGIPSPGIEAFLDEVLPRYVALGPPVIVSIGGLSPPDYWEVTARLGSAPLAAIEVNVSCPNLEKGGLEIGSDPDQVAETIGGVVERSSRPVFAKLTPNVTSIADIARAASAAGAAGLTVANTVVGMSVDLKRRRPVLGNRIGGLSGPAVKPIALRLVWEAARAVSIPVIGCGGISNVTDVLEFLLVGASAVQVGTATFGRPDVMGSIVSQLPVALMDLGAASVAELVGSLSSEEVQHA